MLPAQPTIRRSALSPDHKARRTVIREWMALPRDGRRSSEQVGAFVEGAVKRHSLTGAGDAGERMRSWLLPRIGKN